MPRKRKQWQAILTYNYHKKPSQSTLKRYYDRWRKENGLPVARCDNPDCQFHTEKLEWLGKRLPLILDHKNGNRYENSPWNLRYLCPNCDSQLATKGGGNKGAVQQSSDTGYVVISKVDGQRHLSAFQYGSGGAAAGGSAAVSATANVVGSGGAAAGGGATVSVTRAAGRPETS